MLQHNQQIQIEFVVKRKQQLNALQCRLDRNQIEKQLFSFNLYVKLLDYWKNYFEKKTKLSFVCDKLELKLKPIVMKIMMHFLR